MRDLESPTLQRIRDEVGWNPFDGEPTDFDVLENYLSALEAQVRAEDTLSEWRRKQPGGLDA